ncbi:GGDEF domain-containing protein [Oceanisphaera profunda]|uniref:GGDEF domain-containing protein n=1 Tax=Oceanisphaera profunda TaxID=1416627 RepID=A0A1Y0D2B9_9GAMM|nr:EAL domain-containing protein [Oceanisphaera profunda]ART81670.1 GGDEF domain-containing protein [Oceanisphaera profunda]
MTLYRQLLLTMLLLFVMLFITVYTVQFNATKNYLAAQQETTVINTVTALGLALTPYLETSDAVGAESVINAIFDGGFYKKIQLDLLAAGTQISREHAAPVQDIPAWFTQLNLFSGAKHEATLTSGWLQLGRLSVEGHAGQAYYQLWQVMSRQAFWFALCFLLVSALLVWALRYLLAPLHDIERQAEQVTEHHITQPIPLPKTRELRKLVFAINTMSAKLDMQFQQQADEVERLRRRAFWDPTSELGNRAYFVTQTQSWLSAGNRGAVMLVAVDMLAEVDQEHGFAARDQMIKQIAAQLRQLCQRYSDHVISRISAREFALLIPEYNSEHLFLLGEEVNRLISDLQMNSTAVKPVSLVGIAVITVQDNASLLLTRADNALGQARMDDTAAVIIESGGAQENLGRLAWKQLIETALRDDLFELSSQAVFAVNGHLLHEELYVAIRTPDACYSAGSFLAMVEQFKLGQQLDLHIINRALQYLATKPELRLAVNLTAYSCRQPEFWHNLHQLLSQHTQVSERLQLELPERVFLLHKSALLAPLSALPLSWGIDHFGRHFDLLTQLGDLKPAYVKLDYGYSAQVTQPDYDGAFLAAVCRAAHNMGAQTIATRVETAQQLAILQTLYVDAYQGFVSPPQPLV